MPKAKYNWSSNAVIAPCPGCNGATTQFDTSGFSNTRLGAVIIDGYHGYGGQQYSRILWQFFRCTNCSMGAVAKLHDQGSNQTYAFSGMMSCTMIGVRCSQMNLRKLTNMNTTAIELSYCANSSFLKRGNLTAKPAARSRARQLLSMNSSSAFSRCNRVIAALRPALFLRICLAISLPLHSGATF